MFATIKKHMNSHDKDCFSFRDNYIDNAEHFEWDPLFDYRDQLDEGHISQGDTSGPDFEYARRGASGGSDFAENVTGAEAEFWEERHLGNNHHQWKKEIQCPFNSPGSWDYTKNKMLRSERTRQSKSRKKS